MLIARPPGSEMGERCVEYTAAAAASKWRPRPEWEREMAAGEALWPSKLLTGPNTARAYGLRARSDVVSIVPQTTSTMEIPHASSLLAPSSRRPLPPSRSEERRV